MFPSDTTSIEPHWQRLALLGLADVVTLRNSPDELLPGHAPTQSFVAFSPTVVPSIRFRPTRFLFLLLTAPAPENLKNAVSDGVGA